MKASDLLVKCLENEGVEYVFGIPGEENLDFLESLRESSIKLVVTRHEQAAGFMAATYGRLTGKPGVCLSTLGPGAINLTNPAAYAQLGGMPLMMITGQKPIHSSKQGQFQIIDIVSMMKPLTKYTRQVTNGRLIPSIVREAFKRATGERPGPVHIELPEDVAREDVEEGALPVTRQYRPVAYKSSIAAAVEAIEKAKRPLILVGADANRYRIAEMLQDFVDKTKIPFFTTQMGKGILDERHDAYLGTAALSSGDYLHCAVDQADLIINVGHQVFEKPPFIMKQGDGRTVIHMNFFESQTDLIYFPQLEVVGDIAHSLYEMKELIKCQQDWDFDYFMKVRDEVKERTAERKDDAAFPVIPQRLVSDVRKVLKDEDVLTLDNGMYKLWFARNYPSYRQNTLLLDNALATMGAGLPSAMAAALIYPERRVMTVCGDGGFMMNSQELETAVRLGLNLVVVILNDSGYGMIQWKQAGMDLPDYGLDFKNPDFVNYAESYGAHGHRLAATDELLSLLEDCYDKGGVHVIDVPVDYSENTKVFTEELKQKTCLT